MSPKRGIPWWVVLLGVILICILCVCAVLIGGTAFYFLQIPSAVAPPIPIPLATSAIQTDVPAPTLIPEILPGEPQSTEEPTSSLTGNQRVNEHYLFDDFSSTALGWPEFNDGKTIIQYEDGQYSIQITEPDYYDWAVMPLDFEPFELSFDVKGLPVTQNGTFGVFCQYQDPENYYFIEFDLENRSYIIGQYFQDERIMLSDGISSANPWQIANAFQLLPNETNHISISCYQDFINLYINDEWVTEVIVQHPFDTMGEMAFFVYAFEFEDNDGYKVFFDNVEVYKPVQ